MSDDMISDAGPCRMLRMDDGSLILFYDDVALVAMSPPDARSLGIAVGPRPLVVSRFDTTPAVPLLPDRRSRATIEHADRWDLAQGLTDPVTLLMDRHGLTEGEACVFHRLGLTRRDWIA